MNELTFKILLFFAAASFAAWLLLFAGLSQRRDSRRRNEQEYTLTTGNIVDYVQKETRAGRGGVNRRRYPVVEFTVGWQKYRLEYENQMDQAKHPIGEPVGVLYDISDPTHFHLDSDPVFTDPGGGAIRIALIWIILSAVLTVALAVFVGGASFDFSYLWYELKRAFGR